MEKKYLVVGTWADKVSGMPVTRIAEVNSGINKNGQSYEIAILYAEKNCSILST